jgi:Putative MetA-pathway of phenol degradation
MKTKYLLAGAVASLLLLSRGAALGADSQYNLFNPVPADQMRPFSTDQTTFTLWPYTVDAGHFQIEADIFDYLSDSQNVPGGKVKTDGWIFGWSTIKAGLCHQADLEVSLKAYSDITTKDTAAGTKTRATGFDDVSLASKINLWGNDGGDTALALLPSVTFPTSDVNPGEDYSGGVRLIYAMHLPAAFAMSLSTGVDFYDDQGIHASFGNGINFERELVKKLFAYAEFFTSVNEQTGDWSGLVNTGLAWQAAPNLQIHAGITFGVQNSTDYNPYLGFSWRY